MLETPPEEVFGNRFATAHGSGMVAVVILNLKSNTQIGYEVLITFYRL